MTCRYLDLEQNVSSRPWKTLEVALLYLKHAYNLSDEALVERWAERVPFQFFNGGEHYEHRIPCDPTQIGRFWKDLGIRPIFLAQILVALFQ